MHKGMERSEAEKVAFHSSLPHFPLSAMHEAVRSHFDKHFFSKQLNLTEKDAYLQFTELCQTEPK